MPEDFKAPVLPKKDEGKSPFDQIDLWMDNWSWASTSFEENGPIQDLESSKREPDPAGEQEDFPLPMLLKEIVSRLTLVEERLDMLQKMYSKRDMPERRNGW